MAESLLIVEGISKYFGGLLAIDKASFRVRTGRITALIGPNGAGKTTLFSIISGFLTADEGRILYDGADITAEPPNRLARRGIARTFQINQLFRGLTVLDNVCLAVGERSGACNNLWRAAGARRATADEAVALLEALRLQGDALKLVSELPYGRQRLVEIAIALGQRPKVLLLDEPAAGVPSAESHIILDVIERLPQDIAVLIIEHDMDVVFRFARSITVLVAGAVLMQGTPQQVASDERVRTLYLGEQVHG